MKSKLVTVSKGQDLVDAAILELAAGAIPPTDSAILSKIRKMHLIIGARVEILVPENLKTDSETKGE